ncbi:MAG: M1 family metallopeptidase, partial [Candidatus Melainabacteria bacterium]|nr:M1 family metallopeptidase [Candidatus Melainabacteria bacterium]
YDMVIEPDLDAFTFSGRETIDIVVEKPVDKIVLNAKELEIEEAYVYRMDGTKFLAKVELDAVTEMASLQFAGEVGPGAWKLYLSFKGIINDRLKGFYRSFWHDADGNKHVIATTQFESTDARSAFPCFDEPAFKARFRVQLVIPEHLQAISNSRLLFETTVPGTGKRIWQFEPTMKMSTYLVCFVIGELEHTEPVWVNGKELKVWCPKGKLHLTSAALKYAAAGLAELEKFIGIPYPGGDKIDFIAIPDFAAGAMENLGCITFRETALLINEKTATHAELKRVAEVIIHELVHMWFGDLVTMTWWTWLWLNESFATFLENLILSFIHPEWNIFNDFGLSRAAAMRLDSLGRTHPIECSVNHPDEVAELFDLISYEKGCSVLYMICMYIGVENFRRGVHLYLKRHAYGNAEGRAFWQALEDATREAGLNIPVVNIMTRWALTAGHPLIEVAASPLEGFIELSQSEFKFLEEVKATGQLWPVPIHLRIKNADGSESEQKLLLEASKQTVYVGSNYQSVVVNSGGTGFFRVHYAGNLLDKLMVSPEENLSVIERYNLVNDTWSAVRAGMVSAPEYLEMVKRFAGETDPNVWSIILGSLSALYGMLNGSARSTLRRLIVNLVKPALDKLGHMPGASESHEVRKLRGSLMGTLGTFGGDKEVIVELEAMFASWKVDKSSIDGNLLPSIVEVLAYNGGSERYEEFFSLFKNADNPQEEQRFLSSLASFKDADLLNKTSALMFSEHVRSQDALHNYARLLGNDVSAKAAWTYMRKNWTAINKAFPANGVRSMVGACSALDTPALEKQVRKFFATHKVRQAEMATAQMLEQLSVNVRLRKAEASRLKAHLLRSK